MITEPCPPKVLETQTEIPAIHLDSVTLAHIEQLDEKLLASFAGRVIKEPALTRQLVSNQANKSRASYRWYKYKEAFSATLVEYLLDRYHVSSGSILDPFAGSGTAMLAASELGIDSTGIELLPIGQEIINTKISLLKTFTPADFEALRRWIDQKPWKKSAKSVPINELRITAGAYPEETKQAIESFIKESSAESPSVRQVLQFALLCILESISFTRKDGQYLRWDYRSGRKQGAKPFNKGAILEFDQAITSKIGEILLDSTAPHNESLFPTETSNPTGNISLLGGSCLDIMPKMAGDSFNAVVTSPPYCNRYDYTRTYALELALLGTSEKELINMRQAMLSCTVENRSKDLLTLNPLWSKAIKLTDDQDLLQVILKFLEQEKLAGRINNTGIPRMVRGYFYEMACIIAECSRVLKSGSMMFMVNDNVRYCGASISVDLILSDLANGLGFSTEAILVLPNGKGNSSQQMGVHGREPMRKCVYVWRKK